VSDERPPGHPTGRAVLVMVGLVILIVGLALLSSYGGF
jgi:hypothetical protein